MKPYTRKSLNEISAPLLRLQRAIPLISLLFICCLLYAGSEASAQQVLSREGTALNETGRAKADFLFRKPAGFFGFRMGRFFPRLDSDLFDMVTEELTLEKSDFRSWDLGFDGGFSMNEWFDLVISFDSSTRRKASEFRYYIDEYGMPITQTTTYSQVPLTVGIRFLPMPRGRQVGNYAYLPSPFVPFLSGGGGILWYHFRQHGYFVDYSTLEIFHADLESSGSAPVIYLGGGADIRIFRSAYLTLDLRYSWANDDLDGDFVGFEPIDLSGLRLTAGVHWHY